MPDVAPPARARFAAMVADALDGPVLLYAARAKLLRLAGRMGISRFEANLIIAAVLHRATTFPANFARASGRPRSWTAFAALVAAVLLLQAAIILAAVSIFRT
jgi:hypothetical protein